MDGPSGGVGPGVAPRWGPWGGPPGGPAANSLVLLFEGRSLSRSPVQGQCPPASRCPGRVARPPLCVCSAAIRGRLCMLPRGTACRRLPLSHFSCVCTPPPGTRAALQLRGSPATRDCSSSAWGEASGGALPTPPVCPEPTARCHPHGPPSLGPGQVGEGPIRGGALCTSLEQALFAEGLWGKGEGALWAGPLPASHTLSMCRGPAVLFALGQIRGGAEWGPFG